MLYCVDPTAEKPVMLINTHIGFDEEDGQGINGALFQTELLALDAMGKKEIQIWINSTGGVVLDGYNICSAILMTKARVNTFCTGCAASIAGVIFLMGANRRMADYSWLMYHMPFGGSDKSLDTIAESLIKMVASRTGKDEAFIKSLLKRETYVDADEAFKMGFCTEVLASDDYNKKRMEAANSIKARWKEADKILNKAIDTLKTSDKNSDMELKLITNKLNLNPSASEDAILLEIDKIVNKGKKAEEDLEDEKSKNKKEMDSKAKAIKDMEDELKEKKADYDKLVAKYDKMKADMEDADKKSKAEKDAMEEEDCKNMITDFAKKGRIKNDDATITKWVGVAKKLGKTECKAMIEELPLNKEAANLPPDEVKLDTTEQPTTAAYYAARVLNKVKDREKKTGTL